MPTTRILIDLSLESVAVGRAKALEACLQHEQPERLWPGVAIQQQNDMKVLGTRCVKLMAHKGDGIDG